MIEYRELSLNLETYQASIANRPLDLTYMEYELLKFLAQNPGKVFTREMLLNRVWGYELTLNVATYQAAIAGRPLDLTYMEYELLKFLSQNPGKVFTREVLLNRVWGYEYYGGARTVDVHVRRLRAKLGEEHASLIETVRSVGYRFGQARWST